MSTKNSNKNMAIENLICEICMFADQCDGINYTPVCWLEQSGEKQALLDLLTSEIKGSVEKELENLNNEAHSCYVDTELKDMNLVNSYLFEFIFEACEYFSGMGFYCNPPEIFELLSNMYFDMDIKQLLRTTICKSKAEYDMFNHFYQEFVIKYFNKFREERNIKNIYNNNKDSINKKLNSLQKQKELIEQQLLKNCNIEDVNTAQNMSDRQKNIPNMDKCLESMELLNNFIEYIKLNKKPDHTKLINEIKAAAKKAMKEKNSAELIKEIKARGKLLQQIKEGKNKNLNSQLEETQNNINRYKQELNNTEVAFKKAMKEIVKEQSIVHREIFNANLAKNAVKSNYIGDIILDKSFSKMTEKEKRNISEFIKDNARKFRTRLTKKIRADNSNKIDIPTTIKKSCQTGGIPLKLIKQKPVKQKANLVMILDVSGSCKNASEMMLLFMHAMKEAFPGGCKTYAFTNKLYDISSFFDTSNAEETIKKVLNTIPRAGAYSNYYIPFETFYKEHMSDITGDSYVYFIGDARNNNNKSGAEYVKAIARKAKKAFWLNTEKMDRWNQGDSIINKYAPYMTNVVQSETPAELLGFLNN